MYQFINWLRVIAAILITNAHYEDIYPISAIANGGLLGDVLFFAISGFCANTKNKNVIKWYLQRLIRIYPSVWIVNFVFIFLSIYYINTESISHIFYVFFYPTYYHFVGSILVLYIPFFFVSNWIQKKSGEENKRLSLTCILTVFVQIFVLIFCYDLSYYHIDAVAEPMIRFLFWYAMLIGLHFRINSEKYCDKKNIPTLILLPGLFVLYFSVKLACMQEVIPLYLQWVPQIILLMLLITIFRCSISYETMLNKLHTKVQSIIAFLAGLTLEIYIVQYAPILYLNKGAFPLNFLLVSISILLFAWILHISTNQLIAPLNRFVSTTGVPK